MRLSLSKPRGTWPSTAPGACMSAPSGIRDRLEFPCHFPDEVGAAVELGGCVLEEHNPPLTVPIFGDDGLVGIRLGSDRSLTRWHQSSDGSQDHGMLTELTKGLDLD